MAFKTVKVTILPTNEVKGDFSKERIYPCLLKHSWMFDKEEKGKTEPNQSSTGGLNNGAVNTAAVDAAKTAIEREKIYCNS